MGILRSGGARRTEIVASPPGCLNARIGRFRVVPFSEYFRFHPYVPLIPHIYQIPTTPLKNQIWLSRFT